MKKIVYFLLTVFALGTTFGCSDDDSNTAEKLEVAFVNQEVNVSASSNQVDVVFSEATKKAGTVTLNIEATGVTYGTDFTTNPAAVGNTVTVSFAKGITTASFTFTKLVDALEGQTKNVKFTIASV